MMPARSQRLSERLPAVRGRYEDQALLGPLTWFGVGGPADVLYRPADRADLAEFLARRPADVPVTVFGAGANLLVRDGGVRGVVIRLGRPFSRVVRRGDSLRAGAATANANVAIAAREAGLSGLAFLRGIPGSVGGGIRMNAGAYDREYRDILVRVRAVDGQGGTHDVAVDALGMRYRHCDAPAHWIFTDAELRGSPGDKAAIAAQMEEIAAARVDSQPVKSRTGGSTFKNPADAKAWELIDAAGCRGLRRGGAMVSEQHCNFLINTGEASAADLEALGEEVRRRVRDTSGITLEWEIRRIGEHADGMREVPA